MVDFSVVVLASAAVAAEAAFTANIKNVSCARSLRLSLPLHRVSTAVRPRVLFVELLSSFMSRLYLFPNLPDIADSRRTRDLGRWLERDSDGHRRDHHRRGIRRHQDDYKHLWCWHHHCHSCHRGSRHRRHIVPLSWKRIL